MHQEQSANSKRWKEKDKKNNEKINKRLTFQVGFRLNTRIVQSIKHSEEGVEIVQLQLKSKQNAFKT